MTNGYKGPKSQSAKNVHLGSSVAIELPDERWLSEAYSIIEKKAETQTVVTELRDYLKVDHLVYYTSKLGGSPSADPYIRLTYPASWIARYGKWHMETSIRYSVRAIGALSHSNGANWRSAAAPMLPLWQTRRLTELGPTATQFRL